MTAKRDNKAMPFSITYIFSNLSDADLDFNTTKDIDWPLKTNRHNHILAIGLVIYIIIKNVYDCNHDLIRVKSGDRPS